MKRFHPVDGIFFDMCWNQPSTTREAIAGMIQAGLSPEVELDRARYAKQVALNYMKRFYDMVRKASPDATVYFNSRPLNNLPEELPYLEQVEIEALPTGGWGYMYFPRNVRYARTFDRPYMGMTARFHKSWADFGGLKPYAALEYETSQMMAHGARCSIGDQMHPRGTLDSGAYEIIEKAYARVEEREPWLEGARPVSQIGVFQAPAGGTGVLDSGSKTDEGAVRMLTQLKQQFDVVDASARLEAYKLLILPDCIPVDEALTGRLQRYLGQGGSLLLSGLSGLSMDGQIAVLPEMGVLPEGVSPYTTTYFRFLEAISAGAPDSDHVMYDRGIRVRPAAGAEVLAAVVEPYFERAWNHFSSHNQTPPDHATEYAAAVQAGSVAYISYPVFGAFARHGSYLYRLLVRSILNRLLPDPVVRIDAPTGTEVTVMKQHSRTIVHILQYAPERRAEGLDIVEDVVPLHNVLLSLQMPAAPNRVYMAPEQAVLPARYAGGRAAVTVPEVPGHAMIVFDE